MLNTQPDAIDIGIRELGNPTDMIDAVDMLGYLKRYQHASNDDERIRTRCAVISQLSSLTLLKSISGTGTCQSSTTAGFAAVPNQPPLDVLAGPLTIKGKQLELEVVDTVDGDGRFRVRV